MKASIVRHPKQTMTEQLSALALAAEAYTEADYYGKGELLEDLLIPPGNGAVVPVVI